MKLLIPTQKDFRFSQYTSDGLTLIRRMNPDEAYDPEMCFTVSFRMGNRAENDRRTAYMNQRFYQDDEDGGLIAIDKFNPDDLARMEIQMTLCGSDLEYPVGDDKFKALEFEQSGSVRKIKNEAEFKTWYGYFPTQWAREVYAACLEVNPEWGRTKRVSGSTS